jgi:hypothetical protein
VTTADQLRAAAQYIREHGWCIGTGEDGGPRCILGACASVADTTINALICTPLYRAIEAVTGDFVGGFNDGHCESADDAIAALEIAADLAS